MNSIPLLLLPFFFFSCLMYIQNSGKRRENKKWDTEGGMFKQKRRQRRRRCGRERWERKHHSPVIQPTDRLCLGFSFPFCVGKIGRKKVVSTVMASIGRWRSVSSRGLSLPGERTDTWFVVVVVVVALISLESEWVVVVVIIQLGDDNTLHPADLKARLFPCVKSPATRNQTRRVAEAKESEGRGRAIKLIYRFFASPFLFSTINTKKEGGGENDVAALSVCGLGGRQKKKEKSERLTVSGFLNSRRRPFFSSSFRFAFPSSSKVFFFPTGGFIRVRFCSFPSTSFLYSFFGWWCFASTQTITTNRNRWWFFFCSIDMMSTYRDTQSQNGELGKRRENDNELGVLSIQPPASFAI